MQKDQGFKAFILGTSTFFKRDECGGALKRLLHFTDFRGFSLALHVTAKGIYIPGFCIQLEILPLFLYITFTPNYLYIYTLHLIIVYLSLVLRIAFIITLGSCMLQSFLLLLLYIYIRVYLLLAQYPRDVLVGPFLLAEVRPPIIVRKRRQTSAKIEEGAKKRSTRLPFNCKLCLLQKMPDILETQSLYNL